MLDVVAAPARAAPAPDAAAAGAVVVVVIAAVHDVFEHCSVDNSPAAHETVAGITAERDEVVRSGVGREEAVGVIIGFRGVACAEICRSTATQFIAACWTCATLSPASLAVQKVAI